MPALAVPACVAQNDASPGRARLCCPKGRTKQRLFSTAAVLIHGRWVQHIHGKAVAKASAVSYFWGTCARAFIVVVLA